MARPMVMPLEADIDIGRWEHDVLPKLRLFAPKLLKAAADGEAALPASGSQVGQ